MEWIERWNEAIGYIEEHLTEEIDMGQLGRIACCSSYHFQRMFTYMAGIPLSEYIRRRRMSLAAVDLQGRGMKIIDVAGRYGYSSPTAFNRAFQSVHGIAPSALKKDGVSVKSFPPITFKITVKGVEEMNYRIETKEAFRIVGVSVPLEKDIVNGVLDLRFKTGFLENYLNFADQFTKRAAREAAEETAMRTAGEAHRKESPGRNASIRLGMCHIPFPIQEMMVFH